MYLYVFIYSHISEIYSAAMYESQLSQVTSHAANLHRNQLELIAKYFSNASIVIESVDGNDTSPYVQKKKI